MKKQIQKSTGLDLSHKEKLDAEAHPSARKLGTLKERIWMAPDFDELPPEIPDAMEGD